MIDYACSLYYMTGAGERNPLKNFQSESGDFIQQKGSNVMDTNAE